jgi:hypothetical protein
MRLRSRVGLLLLSLSVTLPLLASNPIQLENAKPGTSAWQITTEASNHEIEGYASASSINRGESISLYVHTTDPSYTIEIYRMGWYGGLGARQVAGPIVRTGTAQVMPTPNQTTGMAECNWVDPYVLSVPNSADSTDWASGFYLAKLTGNSSHKQKYIIFVVRDDGRPSNHYFQSTFTTDHAYNPWGGKSLYTFNSTNSVAATKVSFNRPLEPGAGTGTFLWSWEYSMVRFLEREGYDITYCTSLDTARRGELIKNHKDFFMVGHDEYWSWEMRTNVENAIAAGVNAIFLGGNTMYWQVRFEPSPISGAADRTMVGYKETALSQDPYATDSNPNNDKFVTTKWRLAPVNRPEAATLGGQYVYDPVNSLPMVVANASHWIFAGTGAANGTQIPGLLGYEVDAVTADSPAGTTVLMHSPFTNAKVDPPVTQYSDMTIYTAPSGAMVLSSGTIQWAWGVDDWNASAHGNYTSALAQQMTRNMLNRFAGSSAPRDCQYTLSPPSASMTASGGSATVALTTTPDCTWNVASNDSWLTLTSAGSGSGSATIAYSYAANATGAARSGTLSTADKLFTVTQAACSYTISPTAASVSAAGVTIPVTVTTSGGCPWSSSGSLSWLHVSGTGTGNGSASVTVDASTSAPRSGVVSIAGQPFQVTQSSGCSTTISPPSGSFGAAGGNGTIAITASAGDCPWSATTATGWITLTGAASGAGNGTLTFTVAQNVGIPRDGTITVAGQTFNVHQSDGCTYSIAPTSTSQPIGGGSGSVTVTTSAPSCAWTAESFNSWITIISGATGTGNGTVTFNVASNANSAPRNGSLSVASHPFQVLQEGVSCSYSLSSTSAALLQSGGQKTVTVSAPNNCFWGASASVSWIHLSTTDGSGNGSVTITVDANTTGSARRSTLGIAGYDYLVTQCGGNSCPTITYSGATGAVNGELTLSGGASGQAAIARVTYTLTGATTGSGTCAGLESWSMSTVFARGATDVTINAIDVNGNVSELIVPVIIGSFFPGTPPPPPTPDPIPPDKRGHPLPVVLPETP